MQNADHPNNTEEKVVSCIFKTFDDIRHDCLALQIIRAFFEIFKKIGLDLYLAPYKVLSTRTGEVTFSISKVKKIVSRPRRNHRSRTKCTIKRRHWQDKHVWTCRIFP